MLNPKFKLLVCLRLACICMSVQANQTAKTQFRLSLNDTKIVRSSIQLSIQGVTNIVSIYICSFLVLIGVLGNMVSFKVILRVNQQVPRLMTKHTLILLTVFNTIYLILFWYYSVLPKLIQHFNLDFNPNMQNISLIQTCMHKFYQINSNVFVCKLISYLISVSIFMNSSITVTFSLERALAINFPLKVRNLRENHRCVFKMAMILVILYSFVYPVYNLFLTEIVKHSRNKQRCDIPTQYESLYFKFTIMFVIQTLTLPFILITVSNISILVAIERNRKRLLTSHFQKNRKTFTASSSDCSQIVMKQRNTSCKSVSDNTKIMHIRQIFLLISASFVLLHLPYFVAWCRYAFYRLHAAKPFRRDDVAFVSHLFNIVKLTEMLNLFNYAITGLIYFAAGKNYRDNFYSLLGCKQKMVAQNRCLN